MPTLMTARQSGCTRGAQQRPQARRIAAGHDGGDAGAGRQPGLGGHSGHGQNRLAMLRSPRRVRRGV